MRGLTADQRSQYDEAGYVLLRGLFEPDELRPLMREVETTVDQLGRDYYARGQLTSLYEEHGLKTRFLKLCEQCEALYRDLTVGSPLLGPALFDLLRHPTLLDVAESVVGPEVHCEGRHNLRPKLPHYDVADFRWHEDTLYEARRIIYVEQQYGLGAPDPKRNGAVISRIVPAPQMPEPGFWIPLVDVDETNGCLHVLPRGHRHAPPYDWQWEPGLVAPQLDGLAPLPVPMRVGDALLMHQHLPHVSPPNRSDHIRWSVDIRYQDGQRPIKSVKKPGFLARSTERPGDVVTTYDGYLRIREAAEAFCRTAGMRFA